MKNKNNLIILLLKHVKHIVFLLSIIVVPLVIIAGIRYIIIKEQNKPKQYMPPYMMEQLKRQKEEIEQKKYEEKRFKDNIKLAQKGVLGSQLWLIDSYLKDNKGATTNYVQAKYWAQEAALQNSPQAFYYLGKIYYEGLGVKKDLDLALKYYEKFAQDGDNKAKFELAARYYLADKEEYYKKAFEVFSELHKAGITCANVALGDMYYEGKGITKNTKKAFELWKKDECSEDWPEFVFSRIAYEHWFNYLKDTKQAQKMYKEGMKCLDRKCSHQHPEPCGGCIPAFNFFTAASDLGHIEAKYELGKMHYWESNECCGYCLGENIHDGLDYTKAFNFFMQAAKGGSINAMRDLGYMYLYSDNIDGKDASEAEKWFLKAANAGDKSSISELVRIYFNGFGVDQNMEKVKYFAEKAIQKGEIYDNYYLGMLYYEGKYFKQDYKKALEFFEKASKYPYASDEKDLAEDMLYKMYMSGKGTKVDEEKAKRYGNGNYYFSQPHAVYHYDMDGKTLNEVKELASKGNVKYQLLLADKYYEGVIAAGYCTGCKETLVAKDYKKAFYWYQKAFNQGSREAATKLGEMYEQGKYVKKDLNKSKEYYEKAKLLKIMTEQDNEKEDIAAMSYAERERYVSDHSMGERTKEETEKVLYATIYNYYEIRGKDVKQINNLLNVNYKKYEEMVNKGDNFAQMVMGDRYYKGIGVKQDFEKAFEYFSKASASQRCAESALGNMYFKGEGVKKDIKKAIDLWVNDIYTEEYLDNPETRKEDCNAAILKHPNLMTYPVETYVLFEELAKQGSPEIQTKLGELYNANDSGLLSYELKWDNHIGVEMAEYWFKKAIKQNYRDAYVGMDELKSYDEYAKKAFEMGSIRAYNRRGDENFYAPHVFSGVITRIYDRIGEEDGPYGVIFTWALQYYSKTAKLGDPYGLYHIGLMYDGGYGVEKDHKKALEYYDKAIANINFVSDMRPKRMGKMYQQFGERLIELGKTKEAKVVLNKSIELGNKKSKELLKKIK